MRIPKNNQTKRVPKRNTQSWTRAADEADSEDEFHAERDKVFLDAGSRGSHLQRAALDSENSEEEILPFDEDEWEGQEDEDVVSSQVPQQNGRKLRGESVVEEVSAIDDDGWGDAKADYYNADVIETEQDARMEEAEAKRLQLKSLQGMTDADFGLDDVVLEATDETQTTFSLRRILKSQSPQEDLQLLHKYYPEFQPIVDEVTSRLRQSISDRSRTPQDIAHRAYLGVMLAYFAAYTSPAFQPDGEPKETCDGPPDPSKLANHAIMGAIEKCRDDLAAVAALPIDESSPQQPEEFEVDKTEDVAVPKPKQRRRRTSRKPETARPLETQLLEARLAKLDSLLREDPPTPAARADGRSSESDFGEAKTLTAAEAAAKSKRKTLAFYTSQIAQKANKRTAGGRDAGGDADLPYKERARDRHTRLNAEAQARGRKDDGDVSDGSASAKENGTSNDHDDDDYYNFVSDRSREKKAEQAALDEMHAKAKAEGGVVRVQEENSVGEDGKRVVTYAIEKNKGLRPNRKKEIRNPRVKKRKQFDDRKKKLASTRQVYRGGEGRGGYAGEATGIRKALVRGVRL